MNFDNPNGKEPTVSAKTKVRRTFLKRASATAVVGAIPAKSVWATGVTNSIVASGHGSDFAYGRDLELLGPCDILGVLSANPSAGLDLNFEAVFGVGSGPNQTFSKILSCHCNCPPPTTPLTRDISNVVFYTDLGEQFKIEYPSGTFRDPSHPAGYYSYVESRLTGKVTDYVIKAGSEDNGNSGNNGNGNGNNGNGNNGNGNNGNNGSSTSTSSSSEGGYFGPTGADASIGTPAWFQGHSGIPEVSSDAAYYSPSSAGNNCEGNDITLYMIAVYLNARFDLFFRGGQPATEAWGGSDGIYYPILNSTSNVGSLVASIQASRSQLYDILSVNGADTSLPTCS